MNTSIPLRGFKIIASFSLFFVLNAKSFDFTDKVDPTPTHFAVNHNSANLHIKQSRTNNLRSLPKIDTKLSILQIVAGLVSVVALSTLIVRCIRSLKSNRKSNRRLAAANGGENVCAAVSDEQLEGYNHQLLLSLVALDHLNPANPNDIGISRNIVTRDSRLWEDNMTAQALQQVNKQEYAAEFTDEQRGEIRRRRGLILTGYVRPLLARANPILTQSVAESLDRLLRVTETELGVGFDSIRSVLDRMSRMEMVALGDADQELAPLEQFPTVNLYRVTDHHNLFRAQWRSIREVLALVHNYKVYQHQRLRDYYRILEGPDQEILAMEMP